MAYSHTCPYHQNKNLLKKIAGCFLAFACGSQDEDQGDRLSHILTQVQLPMTNFSSVFHQEVQIVLFKVVEAFLKFSEHL